MLIGKTEGRVAGNGNSLPWRRKEGWPGLGRCDTGERRFDGAKVEMRSNQFGGLVDHRFESAAGGEVGGLNQSKVPRRDLDITICRQAAEQGNAALGQRGADQFFMAWRGDAVQHDTGEAHPVRQLRGDAGGKGRGGLPLMACVQNQHHGCLQGLGD